MPHYAPDIEPLRYSPKRDFPRILDAMRGEDVVFGPVHREHQDLRARRPSSRLPDGFEPVEPRHGQIHQDQIRFTLFHTPDGLLAVFGFANNLKVRI